MSEKERDELRSTLNLLKYLHTFHNEYEDKLSMSEEESIDHRLNSMEEIDRITRLLQDDDDQRNSQTMNDMDYNNELAQDITAYNCLETEQDKRDFLDQQRQKIAQMTPEQRQSHQAAIAQEVSRIAQRVEKSRRSATA